MYGKSEAVVGKLSTDMGINDKLWLATKVWTQRDKNGPEQMKRSLELMGRPGGTIELMQVHNLVDIEEHLPRLKEMKDSGTFKCIGITSSRRDVIPELTEYAQGKGGVKLDFIQLPYNIEMREAAERLLPACKENGVATMINVPFGSGRIFRKVRERPLPEHAQRYASSWAQALLKFILANEAVTVAIPGTSNPKHVVDNCGAMRGPLPTPDEIQRLIKEVEA
jgi:diketogulonate reductase-like aldo/keto reductase